jgi:hypothetical protein
MPLSGRSSLQERQVLASRRPNIWKLQAAKDVDGLIAALTYIDPDVRKAAAVALRVIGDVRAIPALKRAALRERHGDVRDHLRAAHDHLNQATPETEQKEQNRASLELQLSSPNPEIIIQAAIALGNLGDQLATEALMMVFRNTTQRDDVRLAAAQALLKLKSPPTVVTLLAALEKENWRIRHNAATVLGQLKATWATEPLIKLLHDENPNVRQAVANALSRFQTPRALQALEMYRAQRTGDTRPLPIVRPTAEILPQLPIAPSQTAPATPISSKEVGSADPLTDTMIVRPTRLREMMQKYRQQTGETPAIQEPNAPDTPVSNPVEASKPPTADSTAVNPPEAETSPPPSPDKTT